MLRTTVENNNKIIDKETASIIDSIRSQSISEQDDLYDNRKISELSSKSSIDSKKDFNVTSIAPSEKCSSIGRLLVEQHHKRYNKVNKTATSSSSQATSAGNNNDNEQNDASIVTANDDDYDYDNDDDDDDDDDKTTTLSLQKSWATSDSYNLTAFDQINGIWPLGHPLPLPDWANNHEHDKGILYLDNVWQYEDLNAFIEAKLHRMLEETHYDTVNLFLDFFRSFKKTRRSDLKSFFQFYDIPINRRHHMCVSLAMEIIVRMVEHFPILKHYLYIVSCEEQVVSQSDYIESSDDVGGLNSPDANVEKEHALVAMKICIAGRHGVMILDPGYHVARAVTVMADQVYPHTGWFTQSDDPQCKRDYCYNYCIHSGKFVEWMERECRSDKTSFKSSLIYVEKPYVTAIDVTVRRNLVYNFRSLLSRDAKGRVSAGIYLPLIRNCNESHFTLFYDGPNNQRIKQKFMFNALKNATKIPDNIQSHLEKLAPQLNMTENALRTTLLSLAEAVIDQDFIKQVLSINDDIGSMSADN